MTEEKKESVSTNPPVDKSDSKEIPAKFKKLVEEIEKMSVLDMSELVKILEDHFGVSSAPVMTAVAPTAGGGGGVEGGDQVEQKTSFNVELTEAGGNKISVIKVIRQITQQGLKECKDLVDGAPKVVKEGVAKEEAEEMKKKLEEAGAKVTLK